MCVKDSHTSEQVSLLCIIDAFYSRDKYMDGNSSFRAVSLPLNSHKRFSRYDNENSIEFMLRPPIEIYAMHTYS